MPAQLVIPVTESSQVGEARRAASRVARALDLGETKAGEVAIVASELATNLARYTQGGKLLVQPLSIAGRSCVELLAIDSGPGIADISRCLRDGFSSGGTPGTGLGAVRRLSDVFDIYSAPGSGTVILSRLYATGPKGMPADDGVQWGACSVPAPNEEVCGDAWSIVEADRQFAVIVADGLGHGPLAAEPAEAAARVFRTNPFVRPAATIEAAHRSLSGSRGAAVAVTHVSLNAKSLDYAGIGNIAGAILGAGTSQGLISHNGTVGLQFRKAHQVSYSWSAGALLVMHSDGLQSRWSLDAYPGLFARHPAVAAAVLYRDFVRGRDDATVVVARLPNRGSV